jgi:hypothetical protein
MDPEERKELILAGNIEPIAVSTKLQKNEKAYTVIKAKRTATIDEVVEHTTGQSKRKGVLSRGVVGAVITAPLGLSLVGGIVGAATAGNKTNSKTTQKIVTKYQIVDTGELIFTNRRMLFMGNKEIISLDYDDLIDYKFGRNLLGHTFAPRYHEMLPHESFLLSGPSAAEAGLFFEGITQNLVK